MSIKMNKKEFLNAINEKRRLSGDTILDFNFNKSRCRVLSQVDEISDDSKGVLYWMLRDSRVQDNWSILFAQRLALKNNLPLYVCFFCKECPDLYPTTRQFKFLIEGLKEINLELQELKIPFYLIDSTPLELINIIKEHKIGCLVTDFFPLRKPNEWKKKIIESLPPDVSFVEVDAHNIVPAWLVSDKQEIAARTIRPKIKKKLDEYLTEFPQLSAHPHLGEDLKIENCVTNYKKEYALNKHIEEVTWAQGGTKTAFDTLFDFITKKLRFYGESSNDPSKDLISNLSPWIHFGHISAQRCALEVKKIKGLPKQCENFLEELIIRKELSDNFCYYNENYDNLEGADAWAKKTLSAHSKDKRPYIYSKEQFEKGETHDIFWNSAQRELLQKGKIHGYMRMYWCKKILEWTNTPKEAIEIALYLNDFYSLDGSDPNGYVGVLWSICGLHDHPWKERDVFGKIRYMVDSGLRKKFAIDDYCAKFKTKAKVSRKRKASNV